MPVIIFFVRLMLGVSYITFFMAITVQTPVTASEPDKPAEMIGAFSASNNSVKKTEHLYALRAYLPAKEAWIRQLLEMAIDDRSPVVVAEAVCQIGEFGFTESDTVLIQLYTDAQKRFGSIAYTERVRCAIITALGKIGGANATAFVAGLLKQDKGSFAGRFMLTAIGEINDESLVEDVRSYRIMLEEYVKNAEKAGIDPFLYSDKIDCIGLASEIEATLLKGGEHE